MQETMVNTGTKVGRISTGFERFRLLKNVISVK